VNDRYNEATIGPMVMANSPMSHGNRNR